MFTGGMPTDYQQMYHFWGMLLPNNKIPSMALANPFISPTSYPQTTLKTPSDSP